MDLSADPSSRASEFGDVEYNEAYPPGYEFHYWHRARGAIVRDFARSYCKRDDIVLEIGAGRGHYVRLLRNDGFNAYGCDLGNPAIHDEVKDFAFAQTDFSSLDVTLRNRVGSVLLLDVIEHIERPNDFIASILRALPAVRSFIITVPARQELWSNYDKHFRHFRRYDIESLREIVDGSRLAILDWRYFFHGLYLPAWLLKVAGMDRRTAFTAPSKTTLHKWLGIAFWFESKLMPKGVYGTSLVCVCRTLPAGGEPIAQSTLKSTDL